VRARASPRRRPPGPEPWPPRASRIALVLLRAWTGAFFLVTAWWKLVQEGYSFGEAIERFRVDELLPMVEGAIASPPVALGLRLQAYADLLASVALPASGVLAPAILLFEAVLGLCLLLGLFTRAVAGLGFLLMLAFSLAKPQPGAAPEDPVGVFLFTVKSANWPVTGILLLLSLAAAGRVLGLDRWLRRSGPRALRWMG